VGGLAVCPAAEHHAVLHPVVHHGGAVVRVDDTAVVDLDALADALGPQVGLVSVMAVNNEVGSITPMAAVAGVVRERAPRAFLHTDAVQAAPWLDLAADVVPHVDLLSLSAHKFGGPKGFGVLVHRAGVPLAPMLLGGGQERDRRSGTPDVAGAVATAAALAATAAERPAENARVAALRDRLVDGLTAAVEGLTETVPRSAKVAGNAHLTVDGIESEALLFLLDRAGVYAAAGSSCASGAVQVSHVLAAMRLERSRALGAVRLSLGRTTTDADVDRVLEVLPDAVAQLRRSPAALG
jgi:cysteine desulfurase